MCAAAALSGLALAGTASAAQPCWKILINDWYNGRIDGSYPVSCYRAAIKNAPEDIKSYSSLTDDLRRALQSAVVQKKGTTPVVPSGQRGRRGGSQVPVAAPGGSGGGTGGGSSSGGGTGGGSPSSGGGSGGPDLTTGGLSGPGHGGTAGSSTPASGGSSDQSGGSSAYSPFAQAFDKIGPKNATSVPVPLIVLAAVALLLLAAGSAGFVVRRVRGERIVPAGALGAGSAALHHGGPDDESGPRELE